MNKIGIILLLVNSLTSFASDLDRRQDAKDLFNVLTIATGELLLENRN